MSDNAQKNTSTITAAPPVKRPFDTRVIEIALAAIRSDSRRQPETYLRDTVVPHGGE